MLINAGVSADAAVWLGIIITVGIVIFKAVNEHNEEKDTKNIQSQKDNPASNFSSKGEKRNTPKKYGKYGNITYEWLEFNELMNNMENDRDIYDSIDEHVSSDYTLQEMFENEEHDEEYW
jgi:hypothetical protein